MISSEVAYNRRKPHEWDGLVDHTAELLQAADAPNAETVRAVHDHANDILTDDERVDVNRYYGEGLVICEFARRIQDVAVREQIIGDASDRLSGERTEMLNWRELILTSPPESAMNLFADAMQAVPPAPRLLVNVLKHIASYRQTAANSYGGKPPLDSYMTAILNGKLSAESVGANLFAGAFRVMQTIAEERTKILAESRGEPDGGAHLSLMDPATVCSQDRPGLDVLGLHAASLRVDELLVLSDYLGTNDNGDVVFLRGRLPRAQDLPPFRGSERILHQQRLGCPAVNVPGLIPRVMEMAAGIVVGTNAKIAHNRWRASQQSQASSSSLAQLWANLRGGLR